MTSRLIRLPSERPAQALKKRGDKPTPSRCNFCNAKLDTYYVAGMTRHGLAKNMCVTCHREHGVGLGTGHGSLIDIRELDDPQTHGVVWGEGR